MFSKIHTLSWELSEAFSAERNSIEALFTMNAYPDALTCWVRSDGKLGHCWSVRGPLFIHEIMENTIQRLFLNLRKQEKEQSDETQVVRNDDEGISSNSVGNGEASGVGDGGRDGGADTGETSEG